MSASTRLVVVGGGIVAASVAYHLTRQHAAVVIIEGQRAGAATSAGAGIVCPWTIPVDDPQYRLSADGAGYYPELLAMLAEDGQTETGYAQVGTMCVADDAEPLREIAGLLRARRADRPEIGEVTELGPGEPQETFAPLRPDLAGIWISGGARVDGRAVRDCMLQAAARRGARLMHGDAVLDQAARRVAGVTVGSEHISADAVIVAAGAWTAEVCAATGPQLPIRPLRGQIVHAKLPTADTASWPVVLPPADEVYLLGFPAGRVVIGATWEDVGFEYRTTVAGVGDLLAAAMRLAPGLRQATLLETRIGFRPVTSDGRPLLGQLCDGLFVAAGNGPEGLTAGPWTGKAAAMIALGLPPPTDIAPFHPARFQPASSA